MIAYRLLIATLGLIVSVARLIWGVVLETVR